MKSSLAISNFVEISSLSNSIVFLYIFASITEECFHIYPFYPLEIWILMVISFLFIAVCKDSSDSHFAFLHFFSLGMVFVPISYTMSQTYLHGSSGILTIRSNPLNLFVTFTYSLKGFDLGHTWIVYWFSLLFFNLSLNLAIRISWSEPQSSPCLVFADCI